MGIDLQDSPIRKPPWNPSAISKLADAIAEHLEQLILEGALRPGEKLAPERELAEKLEVSRPSLREALESCRRAGCWKPPNPARMSRNSWRR